MVQTAGPDMPEFQLDPVVGLPCIPDAPCSVISSST
uniref:Uncharacterized protein n=1 Tax=Arundo donax TaxID=35708 RepID=A0A0A9FFI9_ARUDO